MMVSLDQREADVALAGEYALGLLDPAARQDFERRLMAEPGLRRMTAEWLEGFATALDDLTPVTPSARIESELDERVSALIRRRGGFSLARFLAGCLVAALLALALLAAVSVTPPRLSAHVVPQYHAALRSGDGRLDLTARVDPASGRVNVTWHQGRAASGRVLQLWLYPPGAAAPVPLGLLADRADTELALPPGLAARMVGAEIAVSGERAGGSPTGLPTNLLLRAPILPGDPFTGT